MSDNVQSAMFDILKRIQGDVGDIKVRVERIETRVERIETRVDAIELRLGQVETIVRKIRRGNAGMLVMMRATAGDFDERVSELEDRLTPPRA